MMNKVEDEREEVNKLTRNLKVMLRILGFIIETVRNP